MSAALATWIALITLTPVRRATSAQKLAPSAAVQLHHRQPRVLDRLVDLLQGRVDEDPDDLALAPEGGADLRRDRRLDAARAAVEMDQPDRPGAEPHGLGRVVQIGDSAELDPHPPSVREAVDPAEGPRSSSPESARRVPPASTESGRSPRVTVAVLVVAVAEDRQLELVAGLRPR